MTAGVLEAEDDAKLAVLATPEDGQWLIDRGYTLRLDLPTASKVTSGTPLVIDYAHVRYLPVEGADGLGDDIDPLELWQDRAARGAIFYPTDINDEFHLLTAEVAVARHLGSRRSGGAELGRASCRARGSQYVYILVGAVSVKNNIGTTTDCPGR